MRTRSARNTASTATATRACYCRPKDRLVYSRHLVEGGLMRYFIIPAFLLGLTSANASAGVFTDDLSRCTIQKTSDADKTDLMRWMFASATRDPALASMTTLTQAQRDEINKTMAGIYNRLILVDCRAEAIAAIKNEGFQA